MGLALNELVAIKYLSNWDVQKMSSKAGYKIVLMAGEELLAIYWTIPDRNAANRLRPCRVGVLEMI